MLLAKSGTAAREAGRGRRCVDLAALLILALCLSVSSAGAANFNVEAYAMAADANLSSSYYGNASLSIERHPWVMEYAAQGAPSTLESPGASAGMLRSLLLYTGDLQVAMDPGRHELSSTTEDVHFSFSASEKSGIQFSASRVSSLINTGFSCEQDQSQRLSTLVNPNLNIMGRRIAVPTNPAPNTVIDAAAYGMPGIMIYLNEQSGSHEQGYQVTALRISMNYRDAVMNGEGEFVFGVSEAQLECFRSDLSLSGLANPSPATVGLEMNYIFTITNPGPDVMTSVVLTDVLPLTVEFQSATATHGGSCGISLGIVTCNWASVSPGTNPQVAIRVIPQVIGLLSNTATLTSVGVDLNVLNNVAVVNTVVNLDTAAMADLSLSLSMPQNVMMDQTVVATGSVSNNGPDTALNVRAYLYLPMTVVSLQTNEGGGTCALQDPQMYLCEWPFINDGERMNFDMELVFENQGTVTMSAIANSDTEDPDSQNNQVQEQIAVNPNTTAPELVLEVLTDVPSAAPGETVNWVLSVDNLGGSSASGVVIYDELSDDLILQQIVPTAGGMCAVDYPSIRCEWPSVAAMESVSVMLETSIVSDPFTDQITSDAWVYADSICPEGVNECDYTFATVMVEF